VCTAKRLAYLERSGPNLEPGTMRVYVTNGPRNGWNIGRTVGTCPGSRRRWVLGSAHAFFYVVYEQEALVCLTNREIVDASRR